MRNCDGLVLAFWGGEEVAATTWGPGLAENSLRRKSAPRAPPKAAPGTPAVRPRVNEPPVRDVPAGGCPGVAGR